MRNIQSEGPCTRCVCRRRRRRFFFFSAHTSLKTMRLKIDIAKERERERVSRQTIIFGKHIRALELDRKAFFSKKF